MNALRAILMVVGAGVLQGAEVTGDSRRGEEVFRRQQCSRCHSLDQSGGTLAPDLSRKIGRRYTPSLLASALWNHAPVMWAEMRRQEIAVPSVSLQDAADLYAFFYSARFFDKPGDAGRGRKAFARRHCGDCHGITDSPAANAPAVANWESLGSPALLAEAMWNHAAGMSTEFARRGIRWPKLDAQELTDILVYLQNHPELSRKAEHVELPPAADGAALLEEKGCLNCHQGRLALGLRLKGRTVTEVTASMWNHGALMTGAVGTFEPGEMRALVAYLWAETMFANSGNAARGERVFRRKRCFGCHGEDRGRDLTGGFDAVRMASAVWSHGPVMKLELEDRLLRWPRFKRREMEDLIAYLNLPSPKGVRTPSVPR